jgi:hypothetical protein
MRFYILGAVFFVVGFLIYGLDHGVYLGTVYYELKDQSGSDVMKKCRYLFVSGISEVNSRGAQWVDLKPGVKIPGYCPLFWE